MFYSLSLGTRHVPGGSALRYEPDGGKKVNQDSFVSLLDFGDASVSGAVCLDLHAMYIYNCTHTHTTHTHTHTHMDAIYIYKYIYTHTNTHRHTQTQTHTDTDTHTHTHTQCLEYLMPYTSIHRCHEYRYIDAIYMYLYVYIQSIRAYIRVYTVFGVFLGHSVCTYITCIRYLYVCIQCLPYLVGTVSISM
jgi:hypothetical protein